MSYNTEQEAKSLAVKILERLRRDCRISVHAAFEESVIEILSGSLILFHTDQERRPDKIDHEIQRDGE